MILSKLYDDKHIEGTCVLLYGASGTGKTTWSAGYGDDAIIMTDRNGIITLKSPLFKKKVGTNPFIVEYTPDESPAAPKLYDAMRNQIDTYFDPKNIDSWSCLVLDDIASVRIAARNKAIELNGFLGKSKTGSNMESSKFNKMIVIPTLADFGTEMGLIEAFLRQLTDAVRSAGKNLIVNTHERLYRSKGENTTITAVKPLFTGADTPDTMPGIFDMVWYIRTVGAGSATAREIITDSEGGIMAKSRWGGMFKPIERGLTAKEAFARIKLWQTEGKLN